MLRWLCNVATLSGVNTFYGCKINQTCFDKLQHANQLTVGIAKVHWNAIHQNYNYKYFLIILLINGLLKWNGINSGMKF